MIRKNNPKACDQCGELANDASDLEHMVRMSDTGVDHELVHWRCRAKSRARGFSWRGGAGQP